jgi:hypothetical protein
MWPTLNTSRRLLERKALRTRLLWASALVLAFYAAGLEGATAQTIGRGPEAVGRRPFNPGIALPHPGQAVSGLDAQKLQTYRTQLQNQIDQNRLSGRDMTPGGMRQTQSLDAEVGRVNGALNGR